MRAVIQRVRSASVRVDRTIVGALDGPGLVMLVGVTHDDTVDSSHKLAAKAHELRIFPGDGPDDPETSAQERGVGFLVVSQFTLYADTRKGRRPTWNAAAPGPVAEPLVDEVVAELRRRGATVATGTFGADMEVELINDGPMTLILET